jgi:hypothetical protein
MNTMDIASVSRSLGQYIVSAKGAEFNLSLGQRPRIREHANASAEGATHGCRSVQLGESRLQRSCIVERSIPGALPQAGNDMRLWRKQTTHFAFRTESQNPP